jgi:RNA polymerase sigma factor (sigma-70 family)
MGGTSALADLPAERVELSDAGLVLACRQGDECAWEVLVRRYQRLVYSVPRRAGLAEDLAADVHQQVFASLLEHLDGIEQPERIGAWLVTTARRETWRVGRRQAAERASRAADPNGAGPSGPSGVCTAMLEIADGHPPADEVLVRLEDPQRVRTAMATLDEPCRELLTLLYYRPDPLPYKDVAAQLGRPVGSIGPTRARCLEKLRRALDRLEPAGIEAGVY